MKNQRLQTAFFVVIAALLVVATYFTFTGWRGNEHSFERLSQDDLEYNFSEADDLDSAFYGKDDCISSTDFSQIENSDCKTDVLTKSVFKVSSENESLEFPEANSLKYSPANTSLNLMMEQYTVMRKQDSCDVAFSVTVNSFTGILENIEKDSRKPTALYLDETSIQELREIYSRLSIERKPV